LVGRTLRTLRDDARKVMFLQTTDGVAILGYAGLGATAKGTEPADWMSAVLRGLNLPLEQSLSVLANAMKAQFPRHMARLPSGMTHNVAIPAIVGEEVRLYAILPPDGKGLSYRPTRVVGRTPTRTPRLGVEGSGLRYLLRDRKWIRPLLRVVKAFDRDQISAYTVADHLAKLNYEVHLKDKTVGPNCIIACRHREPNAQ
jgi:hypothetical protein